MFRYIIGFLRALGKHGIWWYFAFGFTYFIGIGFFVDYPIARAKINSWQPYFVMPEEFPLWLIVMPALLFVIAKLAHHEAMTYWRAARLVFEGPIIKRSVPLYVNHAILLCRHDIAAIVVKNCPYDSGAGKPVEAAYARVTFFDAHSEKRILEFDYPRWCENPMPGYQGSPSDHFPTDRNFRVLKPNESRNTIDFALKDIEDEYAYGFTGNSQMVQNWKVDRLKIPPGDYIMSIQVFGVGLQNQTPEWFLFTNPGKGGAIEVDQTRRKLGVRWF